MDDNRYREELIDRFLQDRLSPEEKAEFDSMLEKDSAFREELSLMSHVKISLEKKAEATVLEKILSISSKQELEGIIRRTKKQPRRSSLYIATAAVACIILIFIYIGIQPKYSADFLFKEYYTTLPYENIPTRGGNNLSDEQIELRITADRLYREKKYTEALAQYRRITSNLEYSQIPENILFYSSVCLIEADQYDKAISNLSYLFHNGVYFPDQAGWYLALSYLKKNQREEAKSVLQKLITNETEYAEESSKLLNKLNEKYIF